MNTRLLMVVLCATGITLCAHAQQDSLPSRTMEEVVLSANKWEQRTAEIPQPILKITRSTILQYNPKTTADLLQQAGPVFVQKSQLGGGSPMIRGFATNRVLIVADGIRMNTAIFRSGNLQNVISIDPLALESTEVIFGPGSLIYGSDAIGGVMDFHTLEPRFAKDGKFLVKGSALARYATANQEKTIHADVNLGWKRWSVVSSFSFSDFDDLRMGKNGGQDNYLRPEYVQRINAIDSVARNSDPRVQRFSGYDQLNFLQKIRFKPTDDWDLQYSFSYAQTGKAPRYDRLIQYRNGRLRFAEWDYDDMIVRMHNLTVTHKRKSGIYNRLRFTAGLQAYEEGRIDRTRDAINRNKQVEQVRASSLNLDASKKIGRGELFYGAEYVHNKIHSFGERTNISTGVVTPMVSRYPDGSTWQTVGAYGSYKISLGRFILTSGLRYSYNALDAAFDTTFIRFPYQSARLRDGALTGNTGTVVKLGKGWLLKGNIATGYRMPNVDDIGKLFESVPGNITVPNPDLAPEYAWNFEMGIARQFSTSFQLEVAVFHTLLENAIVRRPFTFNGQDSITFNGVKSRVEALQNVAQATVSGVQALFSWELVKGVTLRSNANLVTGKETDDVKNEQVPLRHAPPFYGSTSLIYQRKRLRAEIFWQYNSKVSYEKLAPSEQAKADIYAKNAAGQPYAPGWQTLNVRASWNLMPELTITTAWENCTNQRYRPYSSGIVAPGSNWLIALRTSF